MFTEGTWIVSWPCHVFILPRNVIISVKGCLRKSGQIIWGATESTHQAACVGWMGQGKNFSQKGRGFESHFNDCITVIYLIFHFPFRAMVTITLSLSKIYKRYDSLKAANMSAWLWSCIQVVSKKNVTHNSARMCVNLLGVEQVKYAKHKIEEFVNWFKSTVLWKPNGLWTVVIMSCSVSTDFNMISLYIHIWLLDF